MTDRPVQPYRRRTYGTHPSQFVEHWSPTEGLVGTALLIHGGYWRARYGLDLMHPLAEHLVAGGWAVRNIEYRRLETDTRRLESAGIASPIPVWSEMSADVLAAVELDQPVPGPLVAIGHSAGGHLALWAAATSGFVDAVVALAPVSDLFEADRRNLSSGVVRQLLGGDSERLSDLYRAASPRSLLPLGVPQLVVHGGIDEDVPQALATDYAAAAVAAGDRVELLAPAEVDHFHVIDPGHEIWRAIDRWLRQRAEGS